MSVVFVHGFPETRDVWRPLRETLARESLALALPGFGTARPEGFTATKDAYAEWLGETLRELDEPVDVVGHDVGALLTMRVASSYDVLLRSWVVDVAETFHPRFAWPERVRSWQIPGVGEELLKTAREVDFNDPRSTVSRLVGAGVPPALAREIGVADDEVMSQSILDFYRSAAPNVSVGWWEEISGPARSRGLALLLPDPPEVEAMSLEVAERLGAETARLDGLNHCWLAEAPELVAPLLQRFWSSLE
jgi:pimeloyl-ACP methyl ester carboxylesterase